MTRLTFLFVFALALVQASWCLFMFELKLDDIVDLKNCYDSLEVIHPECETYIAKFCLREARDTRSVDLEDCPLGRGGRFGPDSTLPIIKPISSSQPWPGHFQLYMKARDQDNFSYDDRDEIFINMTLAVTNRHTALMEITGVRNLVLLKASVRVECWENYYDKNCTTFCEAHDDDVNGHYSCNSDGSIQCQEGFKNPSNNCTDVINPCAVSPCANNGSCISLSPFSYTCRCLYSYNGTHCEEYTIQNTGSPLGASIDRATITISVIGVLLAVFFVAFIISTTLVLLLLLKQKSKGFPLSRENHGSANVKRTKQEMEAYIESTMKPNFLYDSSTAQRNHRDLERHEYEAITLADGAINAEPNVFSAQNPIFRSSSSVLGSSERQPADDNPGYSYAEVETRYVSGREVTYGNQNQHSSAPLPPHDSNGTKGERSRKVSTNVKKKAETSTNPAATSYNRLNHGQSTSTQPQTRLANIDGLGYDALDN